MHWATGAGVMDEVCYQKVCWGGRERREGGVRERVTQACFVTNAAPQPLHTHTIPASPCLLPAPGGGRPQGRAPGHGVCALAQGHRQVGAHAGAQSAAERGDRALRLLRPDGEAAGCERVGGREGEGERLKERVCVRARWWCMVSCFVWVGWGGSGGGVITMGLLLFLWEACVIVG